MERRGFLIELIHVADNRRPLNMENVASIAESIKEVGLANPPAVRIVESMMIDGEEELGVPVLIHGRHRLEALKALGVTEVDCLVHNIDERDARIMEIDENLRRADLTSAEEIAQTTEREELWREKHGSPKAVGGRASAVAQGREVKVASADSAFATDTAKATGKSVRTVQATVKRGKDIGRETAEKIIGTTLDKQVEIDALAALSEDERNDLVERAAAGEKVSARKPKTEEDRKAEQRQRFWKMWASLDDDVREDLHAKLRAM